MRRSIRLPGLSTRASLFALAVAAFPAAALGQTEEQQVDAFRQAEACGDLTGADRDACLNAQGVSPPPGDPQEESILVTGSRIPRANFDTAQPAVVLGGEQIEQRGYTNLADALEELPAFGVPGSSPVGVLQGGEFGSGQNFVNFLGLGDQRTLTVVNGRRFVSSNTASIFGPTGNGSQVDFNVLPTLLIDRVETIAIGGAPIYGSDAIAGTINVITKRNFNGIQLDGQASVSERGDATDYRIRGAAGSSFGGGRGNVAVAAEYNQTSGLAFTARPDLWLNSAFTTPADPAFPFANQYFDDRRIPSFSETGIPSVTNFLVLSPARAAQFGGFQVGITDNPRDPLNGNPLKFDRAGNLIPIDFGTRESGDLITSEGGNGFVLPGNLLAPTERYLATVLAQFELTDDIRLFGEGWYANSKGTNFRDQPEYNSFLFQRGPNEPSGNFIISLDNPFLTPEARSIIAANLANNPFSDSSTQFQLGRANTDIISGRATSTIELYRFVAGLDGKFEALGRSMVFELVGNYGKSTSQGNGRAIVHQNLLNALNAVRNASGNIVCAPGQPTVDVKTISSTCAPLNPFGQQVSQAARDYVTAITDPRSETDQIIGTASISGSLFDIWGGAAGFAIGYEHRRETTNLDPGAFLSGGPDDDMTEDANGDGDPTNDRVPFGQGAVIDPVRGGFNTDEVFAELTIPLIGRDQNIPGIYSLEFNGAIRYIDHSLAGADPTYTLGATWQPIPDITLRGNFTRSVRSPAITEYFNPTSTSFLLSDDPCDARFVDSGPSPDVRRANCVAAGLDPDDFTSLIVDRSLQGTFSGNPDLVNEKADAWSVGAVIRLRFIPNLTVAVDWVDVEVNDAVEGLTATNIMNACYDSPDFPNVVSAGGTNFCDLFERDTNPAPNRFGQVTTVATGYQNAAQRNFEGLLAEVAWRVNTPFLGPASSFNLGVNYLYNHRLDLKVGVGDITTLRTGIGYSKHQGTANVTYKNEGFSWQWQAQYLGEAVQDPDAPASDYEFYEVGDVVYFNSSMTYEINSRFRVSLIVDNVFDKAQPFPVPAGGGSVTYFDGIRGRYFRFGAGVKF